MKQVARVGSRGFLRFCVAAYVCRGSGVSGAWAHGFRALGLHGVAGLGLKAMLRFVFSGLRVEAVMPEVFWAQLLRISAACRSWGGFDKTRMGPAVHRSAALRK